MIHPLYFNDGDGDDSISLSIRKTKPYLERPKPRMTVQTASCQNPAICVTIGVLNRQNMPLLDSIAMQLSVERPFADP